MTQVTLLDADPQYETPLFKNKGEECSAGEDYLETKYYGLSFGSCHPTVDAGASCPAAPTGTATTGEASTDGKKVRCVLTCTSDDNCAVNSTCATKGSSGVCVFYNQDTHHIYDAPHADNGCTESSADDGVDAVFITTTAGGKASICAPRARNGKCFSSDYPDDSGPVPQAIKDESGENTHCQLGCKASNECMEEATCTITAAGNFCLYADTQPGPTPPHPTPPHPTPGPGAHHKYDTPYPTKEGDALKCTETDADAVEFETSDGKKAAICAPKPQDGKCSADDHPDGSTAVPKSVNDASGSHCELDCSADQTCPEKTECTSVKTVKSKLFAMRLDDGGDCKLCLYLSKAKIAFLMS